MLAAETGGMFSLSPSILERADHAALLRLARALGVPLRRHLEQDSALNRLVLVTKIHRALNVEPERRRFESAVAQWF
ncbi:MAG: hypothetical protein U0165_00890 [Polyangiaceae bacterium]